MKKFWGLSLACLMCMTVSADAEPNVTSNTVLIKFTKTNDDPTIVESEQAQYQNGELKDFKRTTGVIKDNVYQQTSEETMPSKGIINTPVSSTPVAPSVSSNTPNAKWIHVVDANTEAKPQACAHPPVMPQFRAHKGFGYPFMHKDNCSSDVVVPPPSNKVTPNNQEACCFKTPSMNKFKNRSRVGANHWKKKFNSFFGQPASYREPISQLKPMKMHNKPCKHPMHNNRRMIKDYRTFKQDMLNRFKDMLNRFDRFEEQMLAPDLMNHFE